MNSPAKQSYAPLLTRCVLVLAVVVVVAVIFLASRPPASPPGPQPVAQVRPVATNSSPSLALETKKTPVAVVSSATTNPPSSMAASRVAVPTFPWFQLHPFKVARSSSAYGWTAEDGTDTNIIRELAHNELEYKRMVIENDKIYARQLVYHTEPFVAQAQQAVQSGRSLQQITLPGLDGQELQAVVTRTDLRDGGSQGQIYAQLPGDPNSMVTVAFVDGREAFTVISPQDQLYLQAEAREPGEIVVKRINPNTYGILRP